MLTSRRHLFGMGAALLAAPSIVRVSSLMPSSVLPAGLRQSPTLDIAYGMKLWIVTSVISGSPATDSKPGFLFSADPLADQHGLKVGDILTIG